jgi:PBP1b-binding outer membrane lipoprotein LpoB
MKKIIIALTLTVFLFGCSTEVESPADEVEHATADKVERPTDAQLHAYKGGN